MSVDNTAKNFFILHPSRLLFAVLLSVYSLAIFICFVIFKPLWLAVLLSALLLCAFVYYVCRDVALILPSSCIKLRPDADSIKMITRNGNEMSCQLARDSLVTSALTILNFLPTDSTRGRSVVIFPDSMDKEAFREIRVQLKWRSKPV